MLAFAIILVYDTFPKMSTSKIPFIDNSVLQGKRLQAKAKISVMLHAAADVALHVPLGNILALIPCAYRNASCRAPVRSRSSLTRTLPVRLPCAPRSRLQTICRQGRGKSVSVTDLRSGIHNRQQGTVRALFEGFHDTLFKSAAVEQNRQYNTCMPVFYYFI